MSFCGHACAEVSGWAEGGCAGEERCSLLLTTITRASALLLLERRSSVLGAAMSGSQPLQLTGALGALPPQQQLSQYPRPSSCSCSQHRRRQERQEQEAAALPWKRSCGCAVQLLQALPSMSSAWPLHFVLVINSVLELPCGYQQTWTNTQSQWRPSHIPKPRVPGRQGRPTPAALRLQAGPWGSRGQLFGPSTIHGPQACCAAQLLASCSVSQSLPAA